MALTNFHEDITDDVQKHAPYGYTTKTNWDNARVRYAEVTLSSGQILAMHTTPVEVIPATGANTMIRVLSITASITFNSIQYAGGSSVSLVYSGGSVSAITALSNSLIASAVDSVQSTSIIDLGVLSKSSYDNLGVDIKTGLAFSAGDSEVKILSSYIVMDISQYDKTIH